MNDHDTKLLARIKELHTKATYEGRYTFTEFHNITIKHLIENAGISDYEVFGGYDNALKVVARFGNPNTVSYEEPYPISVIKITPASKKFTTFEHRDVLGTIMGLGITRESIGDIRLYDNCAYVFALDKITDYIIQEISKIRQMPVTLERIYEVPEEINAQAFMMLDLIISSERADCLISAITGLSRSKAEALISDRKVLLNGVEVTKKTAAVKPSDMIVIRGYGKFIYDEKGKETGSGNLHIKVKKYT